MAGVHRPFIPYFSGRSWAAGAFMLCHPSVHLVDAVLLNAEGWQSNKECSVMQTHTSYYPSCYLSLVTACVPERAVAWCFDRFLAQFRKVIGRYHG